MQFSGCDNDWTIFHLRFVWLIESSQDEDQDRLIFIFFEACADSAFSNAFFDWFSKLFILFTLIIMWQKWHQNLAWLRPQRAKPHHSRELVLNATALPGHSDRKICFAEKKVYKTPHYSRQPECGAQIPSFCCVPFFCWRFSFVVRLLSWFSKISQTCITVCRDVPPSQRVALGCLRCKMSHIWSFSVVANIH